MKSSIQVDYRCDCGKLLFKGLVLRSYVEAKCPRCSKLNFVEGAGVVHNPGRIIVLTTLKGKIVKISNSVESALGYGSEDLVGENISKIFSDRSMAETDRIFIRKIVGKKYLRLDGDCRNKKGKMIPVSICYQHFKHNGGELFLRIIDIVSGIDKKILAEADFDFAYFCDVVSETDGDGVILYLDRNLEKVIGLKPEDLIGKNVDDLLLGDEKGWRSKNYKMLRARKKAYKTIPGYKVKGKNGEIFEQEVYCTPFYDDGGNFIGFRNMHWLKRGDGVDK